MTPISPLLSMAVPTPQAGKIDQASKAFESLLIAQVLKSAHADGSSSWLSSDDDPAGDSATELAEEQFAQALASRGGLGLAKLIRQGLTTESQAKEGG